MGFTMTKKRAAALTNYKQARKQFENRVYKQVRRGFTYTGPQAATVPEVKETLTTRQLQKETARLNQLKGKQLQKNLQFQGRPADAEIRRRRSEAAKRAARTREKLKNLQAEETTEIKETTSGRVERPGDFTAGNETGFITTQREKDKKNKKRIENLKEKASVGNVELDKIDDIIYSLDVNNFITLANEVRAAKRIAEKKHIRYVTIPENILERIDTPAAVYQTYLIDGGITLRKLIVYVVEVLTGTTMSAEELNRIERESEIEREIPADADFEGMDDMSGVKVIQTAEETEDQQKQIEERQQNYLTGRELYLDAKYAIESLDEQSQGILNRVLEDGLQSQGYVNVFNNIGRRASEFSHAISRITKVKRDETFDKWEQIIENIINGG